MASERWYGGPVGGRAEMGGEGQGGSLGARAKGPGLEERTRGPVSLEPMTQGDLLETWFLESCPQTNTTYEFGPEHSGSCANYTAV